MQVFKYPVTINLWLGNKSCTLYNYDLSGIREQLGKLLAQIECCDTNDNNFQVTVTCKMSGVTTTYTGDNKDEVVGLVRDIIGVRLCKINVGNDVLVNKVAIQHTLNINSGIITRTDSYVSNVNQ